jgi:DNA-binding beta-propeller fold protein YncE
MGVVVEADGSILVVDLATAFGGHRGVIRVAWVTGGQTVVSSGNLFRGPLGVAVEADGNILVAERDAFGTDAGHGGVIRVDRSTGGQTVVSSGGLFKDPVGVAIVSNGVLAIDGSRLPVEERQ